MKRSLFIFLVLSISSLYVLPLNAQFIAPAKRVFNRQDTLRGSITPERVWWDLTYYHLDIAVNPSDSTIYGTNTVNYRVLKSKEVMQIDLQEPLNLLKAEQNGKELAFKREGNVYWISMAEKQEDLPGKVEFPGKLILPASLLSVPRARATEPVYGGHARTTCTTNPIACLSALLSQKG
jgi:hypothetical protein